MKPPPCMQLFPRPSRLGVALVVATHAPTAALAMWLPLPLPLRVAALAVIALAGTCAMRPLAGAAMPQSLRIDIDRRIAVTARDGQAIAGDILDDGYVGPRIAVIVWRPDGAWRGRSLLVLADTFTPDEFRRLRVLLRYSRARVSAAGSSDVEAG